MDLRISLTNATQKNKPPYFNPDFEIMEKKKLELKHLAPYLPYGLKCYLRGKLYEVVGLNMEQGSLSVDLLIGKSCLHMVSGENLMPAFLPLTTKQESFISESDLNATKCHSRIRLIAMAKTNSLYQFQFTHLTSRHFDVFGLIEAGLAIDINTL